MPAHEIMLLTAPWSDESSGEPTQMHRLDKAFVAHIQKAWM